MLKAMGTRKDHVAFTTALYKFSQLTSQDYICASGEKNLFTMHDVMAGHLEKKKKSSCADRTIGWHPAAAAVGKDPTSLLEGKPPQTDPFPIRKQTSTVHVFSFLCPCITFQKLYYRSRYY